MENNMESFVDKNVEAEHLRGLERDKIVFQILEIEKWFGWYDSQVSQYHRAQRTNTGWSAVHDGKTYVTLAELDAEANNKQNQIRALIAQMG